MGGVHSSQTEVQLQTKAVSECYRRRQVQCWSDIKIQCSSKAYPPVKTFKWFVNEEEVLRNDNTDFITFSNLSKDMNKAVVKCQATNKIGTSEVSTVLNVQFNPKIFLHPESVIAKHGEIVNFNCGAVGNPEPEYIWVRGEDNQIVGVSKSLQITAGDDTEDVYKCKVFVEGQELISRPARLDIIRAPVVTVHEEKVATVGDDVVLQCHVQSLDTKTKVTWTVRPAEPSQLRRFSGWTEVETGSLRIRCWPPSTLSPRMM